MQSNICSLSSLSPNPGSRKRRKRLGIGEGSGNGKTCGRGGKGQTARSGSSIPAGFEGGQMPLHRRLPKTGFTSRKKVKEVNVFDLISLKELAAMSPGGGEVTLETLAEVGFPRRRGRKVKITGGSQLSVKFVVEAHAFSKSAAAEIQKNGGVVRVVR
ncbi:MAG: 50S ribosomal protein L15 [Deltaproteobacteria bacterium]|nr:50S ribosomal protein L15 [Deltaproteobacteria bacterium]